MSKNKQHIFSPSECISLDMIMKYLDEQLTAPQMHRVEKHLLDCELCKEAVEGYALMEQKDRVAGIIVELNKSIPGNTGEGWDLRRMAAGVAAVLILGGGLFYLNLNLQNDSSVAVQTTKVPDSLRESVKAPSLEKNQEDKTIAIENPLRKKEINTPEDQSIPQEVSKGNYSDGYMSGPTEEAVPEVKKEDASRSSLSEKQFKPIVTDTVSSFMEDEIVTDRLANTSLGEAKDLNATRKSKTETANKISSKDYKSDSKKKSKSAYYNSAPSISKTEDAQVSPEGRAVDLDDSPNEIDLGIQKYQQKQYAAANILFEKIINADSLNTKALYYNGLSYMEAGKLDQAIANFNRVKKGKEFYEQARWNKALAFVKKGDKSGAQVIFKEISAVDGPYKQKALEELKKLE